MSLITPSMPGPPVLVPNNIRVMVVDDAIIVRSLLSRWIEETPGLQLVAALRNGREANPSNLDPRLARVASGVYRLEGQLMVVLDVDRVLDIKNADMVA